MMTNNGVGKLQPLVIHCTDADCEHDLHCFKASRRQKKLEHNGECRYCGVSLVDWERVHARSINDVLNTFDALKNELIRHHFWHKPVDEVADRHARRKGLARLREAAEQRIRTSVAGPNPSRDGRQTPMEGNILYYAQHATACCCRTCMEYWHAIPKGQALSEQEIRYFAELLMLYVADRLPLLPQQPEKIPPKRKKNNQDQALDL